MPYKADVDRRNHSKAMRARVKYAGDIDIRIIDRVFARHPSCYYCGIALSPETRTLEHLRKHLGNSPDNLVAACMFCNQSKHDDTPEEYAMRLAQRGIRHPLLPPGVKVQKPLL